MRPERASPIAVRATSEWSDVENADVVVIAAGIRLGLKEGAMTREDLLLDNDRVVRDIAAHVGKVAPSACVLVVTNPVDVMARIFQEVSGIPPERVIGVGLQNDAARYRVALAQHFGVESHRVAVRVLGSHSETGLIFLRNQTTIDGTPLSELIVADNPVKGEITLRQLERIEDNVRAQGTAIVHLKGGLGPALAVGTALSQVAKAILEDRPLSILCSVNAGDGIYVGREAVIGAGGVQAISAPDFGMQQQSVDNVLHQLRILHLITELHALHDVTPFTATLNNRTLEISGLPDAPRQELRVLIEQLGLSVTSPNARLVVDVGNASMKEGILDIFAKARIPCLASDERTVA